MIMRNSNSLQEGNLPLVANDSKQTKTSLSMTSNHNRRLSTGKISILFRVIGGTLLFFVLSLYAFGTRYVLRISPSLPSGRGSINDFMYRTGKGNANENQHPSMYQPIATDSLEDKNNEIDSLLRRQVSFSQKPRILGHYYALTNSSTYVGTERLDPNMMVFDSKKTRINRGEFMTKAERKRQKRLKDSDDYAYDMPDDIEDQGEDCVPQYDWQEGYLPTCNLLMETDVTNQNLLPMFNDNHYNNKHDLPVASSSSHSYSRFLANGYWRDVWSVENLIRHKEEQEEIYILKTIRYNHDYSERNFDRHRKDGLAMERLTGSRYIMNIYAACGNSGLFQYADGGSLHDAIRINLSRKKREKYNKKLWSSQEKLIIAQQAVSGVADLHNFAKEGVPAVAHTDIGPSQFVYVRDEGVFKLNDFNRARFLGKHEKTDEVCNYEVGNNPGSFRSPEEYKYEPQSEKVDIFSLANTIYMLLTGIYPFDDLSSESAIKKVKKGERSSLPSEFQNSTDPFDQALIKVIKMGWIQDPKKRASAREMLTFINSELARLGVEES